MGFLKELLRGAEGTPVEKLKQRMDVSGLVRSMKSSSPERRLAAREACRALVAEVRERLDQTPLEEAVAFMAGQRGETTVVGTAFANLNRVLEVMMAIPDGPTNSEDPAVRACAFTSIAQLVTGHTRAGMAATRLHRGLLMMLLSRGLKDRDPGVRKATAEALGEYLASAEFVGEYLRQAVTELIACLDQPDPGFRECITAALRRGEKHITEALVADKSPDSPWPRAAEALRSSGQAAPEEAATATAVATLPSVASSVAEAVEALLAIYEQNPHGFASGYGDAAAYTRVKQIGEALNDTGGMERMLEAHAEFARRTRTFGAARNLEHAWDRIGEWLG